MNTRHQISVALILAALPLASCSRPNDEAMFRVECHCSIVQLIAQPKEYDGVNVRSIGVLIPVSNMPGVAQLYLSKDDARFINDANAVFVDIRDTRNENLVNLSSITGKFVVVEGVFSVKDRQRTIESVHDIRVLPPLPLDNTRFEPGINSE